MTFLTEVKLTTRGLNKIAKLAGGAARWRSVAQTAINSTLKRSKPKAVRAVVAKVALPRAYIAAKLFEIPATGDRTVGYLGAQSAGILLSRFQFKERTLTRKRKRTRKGKGKKGESFKKRAGIRVRVTPGRSKLMPGAFLIRLRRGKVLSDDVGIAIRRRGAKGRDNYTVRYGPSLSQVYKRIKDSLAPGIQADFNRTFRFLIKRELGK